MLAKKLTVVGLMGVALAVAPCSRVSAQDRRPEGGPGPSVSRGAAPADDEDWQRPPPGGPRGDQPPPRRDDVNRPPPRFNEGGFRPARQPPEPRDEDFDRPLRRGQGMRGGPGPEGQPLFGLRRGQFGMGRQEFMDPEMERLANKEMRLESETMALVRKYRQASQKDDDLKKEIETAIGEQFEVRQQLRKLELKRVEAELQRLRDAIERRNKARKQIVERRVAELLGQEEDVGF